MKDLSGVQVVLAAKGADGKAHFVDPPAQYRFEIPGVNESRFVWGLDGAPRLPDQLGAPATTMTIPPPGASKFGIVYFAPHSAGKNDPRASAALGVHIPDDGMHRHDSVDYEVVVSGKINVVLDSGEVRTLKQGDMIVMGGVYHAWRNVYDEPCIFASITIGAHGAAAS